MDSIDVSFVSKFFWKGDKTFENLISGQIYMEDPVLQLQEFEVEQDWIGQTDIQTVKGPTNVEIVM